MCGKCGASEAALSWSRESGVRCIICGWNPWYEELKEMARNRPLSILGTETKGNKYNSAR